MRILTLVAGKNALPDAVALAAEIRSFNAEIDFRLRFLHVEIEEVHALAPEHRSELDDEVDRATVFEVAAAPELEAAARLALLLARERPDLLVVAGDGPLREPGLAAANVAGTKIGVYGSERGAVDGAVDLGKDPRNAVGLLTGVAREIS